MIVMKVKYRIERYKKDSNKNSICYWEKGDILRILLEEIEDYCCEEMKEAIEEKYIVFGEYKSILNRDINLNIIHCSPYSEDACFDELEIKYCPFCGKFFELIEIESKFPENNAKIDKETLTTLEYYLDKELYDISISALKEAMQKKAIPYAPLLNFYNHLDLNVILKNLMKILKKELIEIKKENA